MVSVNNKIDTISTVNISGPDKVIENEQKNDSLFLSVNQVQNENELQVEDKKEELKILKLRLEELKANQEANQDKNKKRRGIISTAAGVLSSGAMLTFGAVKITSAVSAALLAGKALGTGLLLGTAAFIPAVIVAGSAIAAGTYKLIENHQDKKANNEMKELELKIAELEQELGASSFDIA